MALQFPKWKYRKHPTLGFFQSTLVAKAEIEKELGPTWTDDPHGHGVDVVLYPAELTAGGTLMHHGTGADANGNYAHGPAPTAPGISGGVIIGKKG
jgi:hypothetical protein